MNIDRVAVAIANEIPLAYGRAVSSIVQRLIEKKHLYQALEVDPEGVLLEFTHKVTSTRIEELKQQVRRLDDLPWLLEDLSLDAMFKRLASQKEGYHINWKAPDVKIYCKTCERIEPFNRIQSENVLSRADPDQGGISYKNQLHQVYVISYECQSCKGVPEVFMLRRVAGKVTLCGRAPMEHVPVPNYIPKDIAEYYSSSVVAFQSGQVLAALFLLRTVCEQWARKYSEVGDKADVALDRYLASLPADFKGRFPSLRTIYSDLSSALHSANASGPVYQSSVEGICEHFEARKVFKLAVPSK